MSILFSVFPVLVAEPGYQVPFHMRPYLFVHMMLHVPFFRLPIYATAFRICHNLCSSASFENLIQLFHVLSLLCFPPTLLRLPVTVMLRPRFDVNGKCFCCLLVKTCSSHSFGVISRGMCDGAGLAAYPPVWNTDEMSTGVISIN